MSMFVILHCFDLGQIVLMYIMITIRGEKKHKMNL